MIQNGDTLILLPVNEIMVVSFFLAKLIVRFKSRNIIIIKRSIHSFWEISRN